MEKGHKTPFSLIWRHFSSNVVT